MTLAVDVAVGVAVTVDVAVDVSVDVGVGVSNDVAVGVNVVFARTVDVTVIVHLLHQKVINDQLHDRHIIATGQTVSLRLRYSVSGLMLPLIGSYR